MVRVRSLTVTELIWSAEMAKGLLRKFFLFLFFSSLIINSNKVLFGKIAEEIVEFSGKGDYENLKLLLGQDHGSLDYALFVAAKNERTDCVKLLMLHGADESHEYESYPMPWGRITAYGVAKEAQAIINSLKETRAEIFTDFKKALYSRNLEKMKEITKAHFLLIKKNIRFLFISTLEISDNRNQIASIKLMIQVEEIAKMLDQDDYHHCIKLIFSHIPQHLLNTGFVGTFVNSTEDQLNRLAHDRALSYGPIAGWIVNRGSLVGGERLKVFSKFLPLIQKLKTHIVWHEVFRDLEMISLFLKEGFLKAEDGVYLRTKKQKKLFEEFFLGS